MLQSYTSEVRFAFTVEYADGTHRDVIRYGRSRIMSAHDKALDDQANPENEIISVSSVEREEE